MAPTISNEGLRRKGIATSVIAIVATVIVVAAMQAISHTGGSVEDTESVIKVDGIAPSRITFDRYEVSCEIEAVEADGTNAMDVVNDAITASWFTGSAVPGQNGNSIISGHSTWQDENGLFTVLNDARVGDQVSIAFNDGSSETFNVTYIMFFDKEEVPEVFLKVAGDKPVVTLVTCRGEWDEKKQDYSQRLIVVIEPVK